MAPYVVQVLSRLYLGVVVSNRVRGDGESHTRPISRQQPVCRRLIAQKGAVWLYEAVPG